MMLFVSFSHLYESSRAPLASNEQTATRNVQVDINAARQHTYRRLKRMGSLVSVFLCVLAAINPSASAQKVKLSWATTQTRNSGDAYPPGSRIGAHVYSSLPFTVGAKSMSSGAITYAVVSGPATITGSTVTLTGAGTVVLSASQAASGSYAVANATTSFLVMAGITLSPASGPNSGIAAVTPGGAASFTLVFTPGGATSYPDALILSVVGLPSGATAIFSPATILAGSGISPIILTIQTSNNQTASNATPISTLSLSSVALGCLLLSFRRSKSVYRHQMARSMVALAILILSLGAGIGLSGCEGTNTTSQASNNYPITVTATDATTGAYSSTNVTLMLQ